MEQAGRPGDDEAITVLLEAGRASARRAPASAARWFAAALRLLPPAAAPGARVELLTALAEADAATGRFAESHAHLAESLELSSAAGAPETVALVGALAALEQLLGRHDEAHRRLVTAIRELPDAASADAVELLLRLAIGEFYRMDYEGMRGWGAAALDVTAGLEQPALEAAGTAVLAVAEAFLGRVPDALAHASRAAALLDGLRVAQATGEADLSPVLVPVLSHVLHVTGRIPEATDLLAEALERAALSGNAEAMGWILLSEAFARLAAGDLEPALAAARRSVELTRGLQDSLVSIYAGVALASALGEAGEPGLAAEVLLDAAGGDELPLIAGGWRATYFALLTRCRLALGHLEAADQAARRAALTADRLGLPLCRAMAGRAAAEVALARGADAEAARHALAAVATAEEVGARVEAARCRTLAGRALAAAGEPQRAVAELERAAHQLRACGARRYGQEAERELRRLGRPIHHHSRPGAAEAGRLGTLTEREAEVAHLVVDRRTNPEIAEELFLSVKTIETHLRSIFRKLDVTSRYDVARAVERASAAAGPRGPGDP